MSRVQVNRVPIADATIQDQDPTIFFDGTTVGDTKYWMGITADEAGDDNDDLEIGKGAVKGTTPFMVFDENGGFTSTNLTNSVTAVQINAAGSTPVLTVDTTNKRVGFGIATPATAVEIADTTTPQLRLTHTDGIDDADFSVDSNGDMTIAISGDNFVIQNDVDGTTGFQVNSAASTPILNVDTTNRQVGIGTVSPSATIDVVGTIHTEGVGSGILLHETDSNTRIAISLDPFSSEGKIRVYGNNVLTSEIQGIGDSFFNGGNVGIGLTGPDRKLDVLDASAPQLRLTHTDGTVYTDFQTNANGSMIVNSTGATFRIQNDVDGTAAFQVNTAASTPVFNVDTVNKRVGIGTDTPLQDLHVDSGTDNVAVLFTSDNTRCSIQMEDPVGTGWMSVQGTKMLVSGLGSGLLDSAITWTTDTDPHIITFTPGTKSDGYTFRGVKEIQTTDATVTTIDSFVLLDENTYHIETWVVGVQSDGSNRASYHLAGTFYRTGAGNATIQGTVTSLHTQESNGAWNATLTASGATVLATVTGAAATVEWTGHLQFINMSS